MKTVSIIIPAYNEESNIPAIHSALCEVIAPLTDRYTFEFLFVNDGSHDGTLTALETLASRDPQVRFLDFARNFGKELATTAGINHCTGDACLLIDADLQHPVELIPEFIERWEAGADVVVGIRNQSKSDSLVKKIGSKIFYRIINTIATVKVIPNATDFRLLDRIVIDEFNRFSETNRMTRALIDWLGFRRDYIHFDAKERLHGEASYSFLKLFKLAMNSFVSLSLVPLKLAGYLGIFITSVSGVAGLYILLGKYFFRTPFASTFSDAENLAILILFLVGIILMSIGLLALYVANIQEEVINRPLYVIRPARKN
jgi:dolichol-phosphate mannosyltransferase